MSLILYPDPNADSFISVSDADNVISLLTMNSTEWTALVNEDKERLLRIAYNTIVDNTDPKTYPNPLPPCVPEAQALMASHDNVNSISSGLVNTAVTGAIKKQKVGSIEREYYDVGASVTSRTLSRVPASAFKCLDELGYSFKRKTTGLAQTHLGRM